MYHLPGWPQCRSLHRSVCPCVRRPSPAAGPCNPDIHNNHDDNLPPTITSLEEKQIYKLTVSKEMDQLK